MVWDKRKSRLERLIARDSGVIRTRSSALDSFAQKRAREIKAELDPRSTDAPTHRGWLPGDPVTDETWASYWAELPDWVNTFGENLTWNYNYKYSISAAAKGWKNSPLHFANETNTKFRHLGLGIARRILPGDEDNPLAWRWYYVAIFAN